MLADIIGCAFCTFTDQPLNDTVSSRHAQLCPDCPHLTGVVTHEHQPNVPYVFSYFQPQRTPDYSHLDINEKRAQFPEMAMLETRESTFLTYRSSNGDNTSTNITALAEAGYFVDNGK